MAFIEQVQESFKRVYNATESDAAVRQAAFDDFISTGLPGRGVEHWRYTSLRLLEQLSSREVAIDDDIFQALENLPMSDNRLVIVDGVLDLARSRLRSIYVSTSYPNPNDKLSLLDTAPHRLAVLNVAMNQGVICIHVSDGALLQAPLQLVHLTASAKPEGHYTRVHVSVGTQSMVDAMVFYRSVCRDKTFQHVLYECALAESSKLNITVSQRESQDAIHVSHYHVTQQESSVFNAFVLSQEARIARFDMTCIYQGKDARAYQYGLYDINNKQQVDFHFDAIHQAVDTYTQQCVKGLANDESKAVANTRVEVCPGARGAQSIQQSHHLLLSKQAEIDAKPELEIYHDDISCTHGATVGQLNEDSVFYLMSRGMSEEQATILLKEAFLVNILEKIPTEALKHYVMQDFLSHVK